MPLPVIEDVVRATFKWTSDAFPADAVNVMHFRRLGTPSLGLYDTLVANVVSDLWIHTTVPQKIYEVDITELDGITATEVHPTGSGEQWSGGAGEGSVIPAACALIKLTTEFRGRSNRGRIYLPYVAEGCQSDGSLETSTLEALQGAWDVFAGFMAAGDWPMVVASYVNESSHVTIAQTAESRLATQRRRQKR